MKKWLLISSVALLFTATGVQAAGNPDDGKVKSATCGACHGVDGNSMNPVWPKLAGQHVSFIEKQLKDFRDGARKDPLMAPMALALSDQDIADLAAFFAIQQQKGGVAAADKVEAGKKIYQGGNMATGVAACMACHGPAGNGNPQANFPALAGQHAAYLEKSLKDYRSGVRNNDTNKMMQGVVERMTDAEITAVAEYIQGLSD